MRIEITTNEVIEGFQTEARINGPIDLRSGEDVDALIRKLNILRDLLPNRPTNWVVQVEQKLFDAYEAAMSKGGPGLSLIDGGKGAA
jgi:hypothetical protein